MAMTKYLSKLNKANSRRKRSRPSGAISTLQNKKQKGSIYLCLNKENACITSIINEFCYTIAYCGIYDFQKKETSIYCNPVFFHVVIFFIKKNFCS